MTVKELKKELKGEFTNIIPFHTDHRDAIPFTQLGSEFRGLTGKEFDKVLDTKEVVDYKLSLWIDIKCCSLTEFFNNTCHYEKSRTLTIYFK